MVPRWASGDQNPVSGKVRIYLAHYSAEARQVLIDRYGEEDIVVDTESRRFRFT